MKNVKKSYFGYDKKYSNISNYFNDMGLRLYETSKFHDPIFVNEDRVIRHISQMNDYVKNDMMLDISNYLKKERSVDGDISEIRRIIDKFL